MKNEIKVFDNQELGIKVRVIENEDQSISINAEDTAIGFGWIKTETKKGKQYTSVRWERMNEFSKECGFAHMWSKDDYMPEALFYRLGMKASNAAADVFQNWLAFDVIPQIRKTGSYEMPKKELKPKKNLSSANMLVKTVSGIFKDAGVNPLFIAAEAKRLYKEQADIDIQIPLVTDKETMPKLWDCTGMAEELGVLSKSGKPHDKAISAIIQKIEISEDEIVKTAYSRNGHEGVTVQYKDSVFRKVKKWLEDNDYPSEISLLLSNGSVNICKVIYREER